MGSGTAGKTRLVHRTVSRMTFDSVEDGAVTVRERDSMEQVRIPIGELEAYLEEKLAF